MKSWFSTILVIVVVLTACGGDGSDTTNPNSPTTNSGGSPGAGGAGTVLDPNFDLSSVPDDFPSQLMPDSFTAGLYGELGEVRSLNFETSASFDAAVAEYTQKLGEPISVVGSDERIASWVFEDTWIVSVIGSPSDPTLIGITTTG